MPNTPLMNQLMWDPTNHSHCSKYNTSSVVTNSTNNSNNNNNNNNHNNRNNNNNNNTKKYKSTYQPADGICGRYNSFSGCQLADKCTYQHKCRTCSKTGHGQTSKVCEKYKETIKQTTTKNN